MWPQRRRRKLHIEQKYTSVLRATLSIHWDNELNMQFEYSTFIFNRKFATNAGELRILKT